jgi:hypothetical protein
VGLVGDRWRTRRVVKFFTILNYPIEFINFLKFFFLKIRPDNLQEFAHFPEKIQNLTFPVENLINLS